MRILDEKWLRDKSMSKHDQDCDKKTQRNSKWISQKQKENEWNEQKKECAFEVQAIAQLRKPE